MIIKSNFKVVACSLALLTISIANAKGNVASETKSPIQLSDMGSFMFAGSVKTAADGETFHGDHGYAQLQLCCHILCQSSVKMSNHWLIINVHMLKRPLRKSLPQRPL